MVRLDFQSSQISGVFLDRSSGVAQASCNGGPSLARFRSKGLGVLLRKVMSNSSVRVGEHPPNTIVPNIAASRSVRRFDMDFIVPRRTLLGNREHCRHAGRNFTVNGSSGATAWAARKE